MKKKKLFIACAIVALYVLLLLLLIYAESFKDGATITSFPKAVWFSFVTLTTVGYGDLYPVTAAGKLIGVIFLFLSLGALAALTGAAVGYFSGTGLPKMRIKNAAGRKTYVFDRDDPASGMLSESILSEENGALCIFAGSRKAAGRKNVIRIGSGTEEVLQLLRKKPENVTVIFTGKEADSRFASCRIPEGMKTVCESAFMPDELQPGVRFFDRAELCASMYWRRYPLKREEKTILIAGFGELGQAMLMHALQGCIMSPVKNTEYHVIGDGERFLNEHPALSASLSIGLADSGRDSLFFHGEKDAAELYTCADRIILVSDNAEENADRYRRLVRYFPVPGRIQLYFPGHLNDGIPAFGTDEEIYTAANVLRRETEKLAERIHEIYRRNSGPDTPAFEELNAFLRNSNLAAAEHLPVKLRFLLDDDTMTEFDGDALQKACSKVLEYKEEESSLLRRIEHERWVRFHARYNWTYDRTRDNSMRRHPSMLPFDELTLSDQKKDDYAWDIIEELRKETADRPDAVL